MPQMAVNEDGSSLAASTKRKNHLPQLSFKYDENDQHLFLI